jgi:hypothetical protein
MASYGVAGGLVSGENLEGGDEKSLRAHHDEEVGEIWYASAEVSLCYGV